EFTCALSTSGGVYCWGEGSEGQLGLGTTLDHHRPARVNLAPHIAELQSADFGACAMSDAGQVFCWGGIGVPTAHFDTVPSQVFGDEAMLHVVAGGGRLCALTSDKTMVCHGRETEQDGEAWIDDNHGNLVNGIWLQDSTMAVDSWPGDLSSGGHVCYLVIGGDAYCEGSNAYGGLGDGGTSTNWENVKVAGGHTFRSIT